MIPILYPYVTHMILCLFCKNHAYIEYIRSIYSVFVENCLLETSGDGEAAVGSWHEDAAVVVVMAVSHVLALNSHSQRR